MASTESGSRISKDARLRRLREDSVELVVLTPFVVQRLRKLSYREGGPHAALEPGDDRIRSVCDLVEEAWRKYRRPCIIAETAGRGPGRPHWLDDITTECLAAIRRGVDLHGICLFPAVDITDWHTGEWLRMGLADVERRPDGRLERTPSRPYVDALHRWQRRLNRATSLDSDPFSHPVDLDAVARIAAELGASEDRDWE